MCEAVPMGLPILYHSSVLCTLYGGKPNYAEAVSRHISLLITKPYGRTIGRVVFLGYIDMVIDHTHVNDSDCILKATYYIIA